MSIVPLFSILDRRQWWKEGYEKNFTENCCFNEWKDDAIAPDRAGKLSERSRNGQVDVPGFCILSNFVVVHTLYEVLFINYAGERPIFLSFFAATRSRASPSLRTIAILRDFFSIHGFYSRYVSMFEKNRGEYPRPRYDF